MRQKISIAAVVVAALVAFVGLVGAALWFYPPMDSASASGGTVSEQQAGDLADAARFRQQAFADRARPWPPASGHRPPLSTGSPRTWPGAGARSRPPGSPTRTPGA
ncbi:hypothetical protein [Pseudonocardia sp. KRD291]|uniref:hypothetical protein n=1 Tax=Pseudonocardia sp. KRD291 TaxID=2792007 RepID=UPI001C49EE68|nr:hypothetical protein [Pseudonocardia sp. KRD291]MBW0103809.1 hypothetical protein [Pseudonocardia sp. KRD291]